MKTIMLSSVIQPYKIFFYTNSKRWPLDTKLCVGLSVLYHLKACIHTYYHAWEFFEKPKYQSCNAQNRSSGEMANNLFETYKILSWQMKRVCFSQHLTWRWQKCVHIYYQKFITTLEKCVVLLFAISIDWSSNYIIISAPFKFYPNHVISCLSTHSTF